ASDPDVGLAVAVDVHDDDAQPLAVLLGGVGVAQALADAVGHLLRRLVGPRREVRREELLHLLLGLLLRLLPLLRRRLVVGAENALDGLVRDLPARLAFGPA